MQKFLSKLILAVNSRYNLPLFFKDSFDQLLGKDEINF